VTAEKVHTPWWKRIFKRRRRTVPASAAGAAAGTAKRPKRSVLARALPLVRRVVGIALIVGGLVYATVAPVRTWVNDGFTSGKAKVESIIHPQYTPVHPFEVTGAAALKDHPASALSDGFTNTFWAAPVGDKAVVMLRFDHPVEVQRALIRVGVSGNFSAANRPHDLHLVFSNGRTQDLSLDDKPDPQEVKIKTGGKITSIELRVTSLYRTSSDSVAITEIEWFTKK
jgi:hypothetical protein